MRTFTTNLIKNFMMKVTTPRFSRYASGLCLILTMLFTLGVGQMWAATKITFPAGTTIYYDFTAISGGGNYSTSSFSSDNNSYQTYDASLGGKLVAVYFSSSFDVYDDQYIAKTGTGGWVGMKWTKPSSGQNVIKVNADGKTYSWGTAEVALAGGMNSWSTTANKSTTGSIEIELAAHKTYEFKMVYKGKGGDKYCGMSTWIVNSVSNYGFTYNGGDNAKMTTAGAGTYTFSYDLRTHQLSVTYPEVTHPSIDYVYLIDYSWSKTHLQLWNSAASVTATGYPGPQIYSTTTIGGTSYYYAAAGDYGNLQFSDGSENNSGTLTTTFGQYARYSSGWGWGTFTSTITLNNQAATTAGTTSQNIAFNSGTLSTIATAPAKTGYTWGGYYTQIAGGGSQLINSSKQWIASVSGYTDASKHWIKEGGTATLYAKWTQNITLNQNGATTNGTTSLAATYNATLSTAGITNPSKTNYTFAGWTTGSGGSGSVVITSGKAVNTVSNWTDSDKKWIHAGTSTLYAKWTENTHTVTVAKDPAAGGTTNVSSVSGVGVATASGTITATANPGYYFTGWTIPSGVTLASGTTSSASITINATADSKTITANFAPIWTVAGNMDEWSTTSHKITNITASAGTMVSGYVDITLAANTDYEFKVLNLQTDTWWGSEIANNGITYANKATAKDLVSGGANNQKLRTATAGTYRFTWDVSSSQVLVTYPAVTPYTISISHGWKAANGQFGAHSNPESGVGGTITSAVASTTGSLAVSGSATRYIGSGENVIFTHSNPNTGYSFLGWGSTFNNGNNPPTYTAYTHNGSTIVINDGSKTMTLNSITSNKSVYAFFKENVTTVTVNAKAGQSGMGQLKFYSTNKDWGSTANVGVTTGQSMTAEGMNYGYKLKAWTLSGGATLADGSSLTNKTITVKGNGTNGSTGTATAEFEYGYVLRGSLNDDSGNGGLPGWSATDSYIVPTGVGTTGTYTATLNRGQKYKLKVFRLEGDYWYGYSDAVEWVNGDTKTLSGGGNNIVFTAGANGTYTFTFDFSTKALTITYPTAYSVTYHGNGSTSGSVPTDATPYASGETVYIQGNLGYLAKSNYTLSGWNTTEHITGTTYGSAGGESFTITANTNLYAKWTHAISLDKNGGTGSSTVTATYNSSTLTDWSAPTRTGYTFAGYWTSETSNNGSGTLVINTSGVLQANVDGYTDASGNWTSSTARTLYAKWTINNYNIDPIGVTPAGYGTVSPTSVTSIPYNSTITTSSNTFTVKGTTVTATPAAATAQYTYSFVRWNNVPATMPANNVTNITAEFSRTVNPYTIRFLNYDGSVLQSSSVNYGVTPSYGGSTPTKPADETYTYTFTGWSPAISAVTGAQDYTAQYSSTFNVASVHVGEGAKTYFTTLAAAVADAKTKNNAVITILRNITGQAAVTYNPTSNYSCTLDLNNHSVAGTANKLLTINRAGATFTITDNSVAKGGSISVNGSLSGRLYCLYVTAGSLNLTKGAISCTNNTSSKSATAVGVEAGALIMDGGSLTSTSNASSYAIYSNGSSTVTINNGAVTATTNSGATAMSIYSQGTTEINGGTFTATSQTTKAYGIYAPRGTVTVNNNPTFNITSGSTTAYGAFAYGTVGSTGQPETKFSGTITINGGTFNVTSTTTTAYGAYAGLYSTDIAAGDGNVAGTHKMPGIIEITDGTFNVTATTTNACGVFVAAKANESGDVGTTARIPKGTITGGKFYVLSSGDDNATAYAVNKSATNANLLVEGGYYNTKRTNVSSTSNLEDKYTHSGKATSLYRVFDVVPALESKYNYKVARFYTISYNAGASGTGDAIANGYKAHGDDFTLSSSTFTRTGYTQTGWSTSDGGGKAYNLGGTYSTDADATLYPFWTINTHTVTYSAPSNGNYTIKVASGTASSASKSANYGQTITIAATPTTGYHFVSWTITKTSDGTDVTSTLLTGSKPTTASTTFTMPDYGVTVTAAFAIDTYAISYAAGTYGSGSLAGGTKTYGVAYTLSSSSSAFTRTGYTYDGWSTNAAGSSKNYNLGASYTTNAALALYPHWVVTNYTIGYTLNGGSVATPNPTSYTVESSAITLNNPTKTGYTFAGWTGTGLASATTTVTIAAGSTGNRSYTATWTANTNTAYTVKHYKQKLDGTYDATPDDTDNLTGTTASSVTPAVKSYEGFTAPSTQTVTILADGSRVVEYKYTRNTYTLAWSTDGDPLTGSYTSGSTKFGASITAPNTPTKTNYVFAGWSPDVAATMPAANTTYTATWTAAVAKVQVGAGTPTYYTTVAAAIGAANALTNPTVTILQTTSTTEVTITAAMTIDLNGCTVSSTETTGKKAVFNISTSAKATTVTIQDSGSGGMIKHEATVTDYLYGVYVTKGTLNVTGGTIYAKNTVGTNASGYRTYAVVSKDSNGVINISGGSFEAYSPSCQRPLGVCANGNLTMTGGTIIVEGLTIARGIYVKNTTTSLTNVTVTATATSGYSYAIQNNTGTLTVNSGTYTAIGTSSTYAIQEDGGTVNIINGKFSGTTKELNVGGGTASISGGNYVHKTTVEDNCETNYYVFSKTLTEGGITYNWEVAEGYTLTWNLDGGDISVAGTPAGTVKVGATVTAPTVTKTGYTFASWSPAVVSPMPASDKTYTATWTAKQTTVTLNANTANHGSGSNRSVTATYNAALPSFTATTPATGYHLVGYYTDATSGTKVINANGTFAANSGIWNRTDGATLTLYAHYEANTYTVVYNANDASYIGTATGSTASSSHTYDAAKALTSNGFSLTGYTFGGWGTTTGTSAATYTNGQSVTNLTSTDGGTVNLYARWNIQSYTLTWNLDGGKVTVAGTQAPVNATGSPSGSVQFGATVTAPTVTKTGYTFAGWSSDVVSPMPASAKTYTATWTANTNTAYTVNHYKQNLAGDGYDLADTDNLTGTTGASVTPAVKSYTGFTAPSTQTVTILADGSRVVTYNYTRDSYTLTWNANGGTITGDYTSGSVKYGASITAPANANVTRANYEFAGWSTTPAATMPAANTTYTAQWTAAVASVAISGGSTTYYSTVTGAFTAANAATAAVTITMLSNASVTTALTYSNTNTQNCTLDLNGHTLTSTTSSRFPLQINMADVTFTITDNSVGKTGKLSMTSSMSDATIFGAWANVGNLVLEAGTIEAISSTQTIAGATAGTNGTFTMNGGTIHVQTSNSKVGYGTYYNGVVTINDGTIHVEAAGNACGVKYAGEGTSPSATVNGGKFNINGATAYATDNASNITIEGGWYTTNNHLASRVSAPYHVFNLDDATYNYEVALGYTLTWTTDGDALTGTYTSGTTKVGTTIVAPNTPTKTGYTFNAWSPVPAATMPAANTEYTATWTANTNTAYTVKHWQQNLANDDYTEVTGDRQSLTGTTATSTAAVAKTYTGFTSQSFSQGTIAPDGSTVVNIYYNRNKYTITWKSEDGTSTLETDSNVKYGATTAFNSSTPTKAATAQYTYTFDGWATSASGAKVYDNGSTPTASASVTYYAHFSSTVNNYTVTVARNNTGYGTVSASSITSVPYGTTVSTSTNTLTVTGKTPVTATPTAATAQYTYAFNNWTGVPATVTGNVTITANFTRTVNNYTVTFNMQGHGSAPSNQTIAYGGKVTQPSAPTATGYTFGGWYKEAGCTNAWNFSTDVVTGATTLYAKWTINSYTITFDSDGGSAVASITQNYGTAVSAPSAPTKTGYTFAGWDPAVPSTMPASNTTCVAQWTANTNTAYTVNHYQQNLDGTYPGSPTETDNLTGTTGASVTPAVKSYTGFTAPSTQTETILADGSLVIEYQYTRNSYTLTWALADGKVTTAGTCAAVNATGSPSGSVKYGASITVPGVARDGYTFSGWNTTPAGTMPAAATTYTAQWTENVASVTVGGSTTYYTTIDAAWAFVNEQSSDMTVTILKDITGISSSLVYTPAAAVKCTLNLNNHLVKGAVSTALLDVNKSGGTFVITDESVEKGGELYNEPSGEALYYGAYLTAGTLKLLAGKVHAKNTSNDYESLTTEAKTCRAYGIYVAASQTFQMSGGEIEGEAIYVGYGLVNAGSATISGGTIHGKTSKFTTAAGVYSTGTTNISGGTIKATAYTTTARGLYIAGGTTNINSGDSVIIESKTTSTTAYGIYHTSGTFNAKPNCKLRVSVESNSNTAYGIFAQRTVNIDGGKFFVTAKGNTAYGILTQRGTTTIQGNPEFTVKATNKAYGVAANGTTPSATTLGYSGTIKVKGGTFNVETTSTTIAYGAYAYAGSGYSQTTTGSSTPKGNYINAGTIEISGGEFNVKAKTSTAYGIYVANGTKTNADAGEPATAYGKCTVSIVNGNTAKFKVISTSDATKAYAMNTIATTENLVVEGGYYSTKRTDETSTSVIEDKYTATGKSDCNYTVEETTAADIAKVGDIDVYKWKVGDFTNIFRPTAASGVWSVAANWTKNEVPTIETYATIEKPCVVDITGAQAKSVVLAQDDGKTGSLDISAGNALVVATTVKKTTDGSNRLATSESDLNFGSTLAAGTGALVMKGYESGDNKATVNFATKAKKDGSGHWINQYIGTPFNDQGAVIYNYYETQLYAFHPANNGTYDSGTDSEADSWWSRLASSDGMDPFIGYNILRSKSDDHTLWMQGTLNASSNVTLNGEKLIYGGGSKTENLLANSWMAPIHIEAFENSDFSNVEKTIYIFNAGSPEDYKDPSYGSASTSAPGQYIVLPISSTPWISPVITVIPAMQAFSVYATGSNPSLTLDYNRLVYTPALTSVGVVPTRTPRRAKAEEEAPEVIHLYTTAASGYAANAVILGREDFSEGFDNGWDGRYMEGDYGAPQLYAPSADGNLVINCVPDIEGTVLCFSRGTDDNEYTFTFEYKGDDYWYLNDMKEHTSTLIAEYNNYTFTSASDDLTARFVISHTPIAHTPTDIDNTTNNATIVRKIVIDDKVFIIRNGQMYHVTGVLCK